jgi:hypothetical protein
MRPWEIVEAGLQERYGADDEFEVHLAFRYLKSVQTGEVSSG